MNASPRVQEGPSPAGSRVRGRRGRGRRRSKGSAATRCLSLGMWLANTGDPSALWSPWVAERRGPQAADTRDHRRSGLGWDPGVAGAIGGGGQGAVSGAPRDPSSCSARKPGATTLGQGLCLAVPGQEASMLGRELCPASRLCAPPRATGRRGKATCRRGRVAGPASPGPGARTGQRPAGLWGAASSRRLSPASLQRRGLGKNIPKPKNRCTSKVS